MYDGTLAGNWQAIITFQQMIVLCDVDGVIDMTPQAISSRTSIPLEIIQAGIGHLENPDPYSRSQEAEGRRIERLDDHRTWGWRIVNYTKYRHLRDSETVRNENKERQRRRRESLSHVVTTGHASSPQVEAEVDVKERTTLSSKLDAVDIDKVNYKHTAIEVLSFLNEKTGRKYPAVKTNIDLIMARLREGFTLKQLRQVIAKKCSEWGADEKMVLYLRPKTLFSRTNFANYVGELVAPKDIS